MVTQSAEPPAVVDPSSPPERRARRIRWSFWIVVAFIAPFSLVMAGVVVVLLWWQLAHIAAVQEVKAEVARIQATGQPITIADWYAYHRVPEGTNDITPLWLAAMRSYDNQMNSMSPEAHQRLPIIGTGDRKLLVADIPGSLVPETESLLVKYDPTVQAMLTAARARGECRYPVPFASGSAMLLPQIQQLRGLVRIMSLRTRVALARGKPDVAIESIEASLAAGKSFEHQPSLVDYLVQIAVTGVALYDIKDLLNEAELTDEQLVGLQIQVQAVQVSDGLTSALVGERGVGYHSFHTFPPPPATGPAPVPTDPMAGGKLTTPRPCLIYLSVMQEVIDASHVPAPKSLDEVRLVTARLATQSQSTNPLTRMSAVPAAQVLPAAEATFSAAARTQALRGLLLLAIAAKRHKLKHGSGPTSLNQLVPEFLPGVPTDPFDGQPLRMKVADGELVFYSVGIDRIDNGGPNSEDQNAPDMVVRLKVSPPVSQ